MIIDFEHHYIPVELGRRFGIDPVRKEAAKAGDATVHAQLFDLEAQLRDMDQVGIDVAVQSCILGWDTTLENCRLINDCTAQAQKQSAGRFVGLAHAPVLEKGGLGELERSIGELALKGVTISSQVNGRPLDASEFAEFYESMQRLRVPIFIHPALAPKGYSLMNDYQLPVILTREFDLGLAVTRLIAGGIIERYPDLMLVFAHFGGGLAGYKERIARSSYRFKLPRRFEEYFDRLYFDMAGFEGSPVALRCALEGIRPEQMIFATDYPQNFNNTDPRHGQSVQGIKSYIEEIERLPFAPAIKQGMLGGIAAKLLKI
jgi:predicted TIM-barrel fold metal-dependent hydrolase